MHSRLNNWEWTNVSMNRNRASAAKIQLHLWAADKLIFSDEKRAKRARALGKSDRMSSLREYGGAGRMCWCAVFSFPSPQTSACSCKRCTHAQTHTHLTREKSMRAKDIFINQFIGNHCSEKPHPTPGARSIATVERESWRKICLKLFYWRADFFSVAGRENAGNRENEMNNCQCN